MRKSVLIGIVSAFFFTATFILNRSMNLTGGSFLWASNLRFIFMYFILLLIMKKDSRKNVREAININPKYWLLYSTIGFGLFYFFLSAASDYGESWFIASLWQLTTVCGILLTPLFGYKIPLKPLFLSVFILIGVFLLQYENILVSNMGNKAFIALIFVLIAGTAYPLGNRKMMALVGDSLTAMERLYGMTIMSLPFWLIIAGVATYKHGLPSLNQLFQSFLVALSSGIIAMYLYFKATNMEKDNPHYLALVESTVSAEVLFALLGGIFILGDRVPSIIGLIDIGFIFTGIILSAVIKE